MCACVHACVCVCVAKTQTERKNEKGCTGVTYSEGARVCGCVPMYPNKIPGFVPWLTVAEY